MKVFFVSTAAAIISLFCADTCGQLNKVGDGKARNLYVDAPHLWAGKVYQTSEAHQLMGVLRSIEKSIQ